MRLTSTKVVPSEHAASAAIIVLWILSAALVIASWFGSYITLAAGPEGAWAGPSSWPAWQSEAIMIAIGFQIAVSAVQWGMRALYRGTKNSAFLFIYFVALLASAVPSFLTYWGWAGADLTMQVGNQAGALLLLAIGVLAGDWLPEQTLLK